MEKNFSLQSVSDPGGTRHRLYAVKTSRMSNRRRNHAETMPCACRGVPQREKHTEQVNRYQVSQPKNNLKLMQNKLSFKFTKRARFSYVLRLRDFLCFAFAFTRNAERFAIACALLLILLVFACKA